MEDLLLPLSLEDIQNIRAGKSVQFHYHLEAIPTLLVVVATKRHKPEEFEEYRKKGISATSIPLAEDNLQTIEKGDSVVVDYPIFRLFLMSHATFIKLENKKCARGAFANIYTCISAYRKDCPTNLQELCQRHSPEPGQIKAADMHGLLFHNPIPPIPCPHCKEAFIKTSAGASGITPNLEQHRRLPDLLVCPKCWYKYKKKEALKGEFIRVKKQVKKPGWAHPRGY